MKYNTEMAAMHSDHYKQSVGFKIKKIFRRRATTASKEDECVELMKEEDQEALDNTSESRSAEVEHSDYLDVLDVLEERTRLAEDQNNLQRERKILAEEKMMLLEEKEHMVKFRCIYANEKLKNHTENMTIQTDLHELTKQQKVLEDNQKAFDVMKTTEIAKLEQCRIKLKEQHEKIKAKKTKLKGQILEQQHKYEEEKAEIKLERSKIDQLEKEMVERCSVKDAKFQNFENRFEQLIVDESKLNDAKKTFDIEKTEMLSEIEKQKHELDNLKHLLHDAAEELEEQIVTFKEQEKNKPYMDKH